VEALAARDMSLECEDTFIDIESPTDKAIKLLGKFLEGQEVRFAKVPLSASSQRLLYNFNPCVHVFLCSCAHVLMCGSAYLLGRIVGITKPSLRGVYDFWHCQESIRYHRARESYVLGGAIIV
jgi:hypothetical protein